MGRVPKFDDEEILDRAMAVVWRDGWSNTSIRDLEPALELKAPSIYRRFGTKEGLGAAVVDHYVDRVVRRRVDRHLSGRGDPVKNIETFFERSVTQPHPGQPLRGCLLTTTASDLGSGVDRTEPMTVAVRRGMAVIEEGLRREVERGAEMGLLAPGVDPESVTACLTLVMQGLMALARSGVPASELQRRARAAVAAIT